jgi:hypothetical protein
VAEPDDPFDGEDTNDGSLCVPGTSDGYASDSSHTLAASSDEEDEQKEHMEDTVELSPAERAAFERLVGPDHPSHKLTKPEQLFDSEFTPSSSHVNRYRGMITFIVMVMSIFAETMPISYSAYMQEYPVFNDTPLSWGHLNLLRTLGIDCIVNMLISATDPRAADILGRPSITLQMFVDELPPIQRTWSFWGTYIDVPTTYFKGIATAWWLYIGSSIAKGNLRRPAGIAQRMLAHLTRAVKSLSTLSALDQRSRHYQVISRRNVTPRFRAVTV